jgi:putative ABC transport system permease protein
VTALRWRYIWRSLWLYRARTLLIVLSVAVGIFAFGLILGTADTLRTELPLRYQDVTPASAVIHSTPFSLEMINGIRRMPEVAMAEGRVSAAIRFRKASGEWQDLKLFALEDYLANHINIVRPYQGAWPPPYRQALIERNSLALLEAAVGGDLLVENSTGLRRTLTLAGLAHDMNQPPAQITGVPYAYVTRDTLTWLGLSNRFNELHLLVAEGRLDQPHITQVADAATAKFERSGLEVYWTEVPEPGKHFVEDFLPTILIILVTLGLLALILSGFLVVNVITALLTQQARQIGVMKAIGAQPGQIAGLYLRMAAAFGLIALIVALPLSILVGRIFSRFIAAQLNFDLTGFALNPRLIALQIVVGSIVPVLAALFPVVATVRRTVHAALNGAAEASTPTPVGGLGRKVLAWQQQLPLSRPVRLSLRNTFRRRGRLVRTLIPLMLGGAIFMSVLSVRASLFLTLEETLVERGFDVQVQFAQSYPIRRLTHEVGQIGSVAQMEGWLAREGVPVRANGSQGDTLILYGLPAATEVYQPALVAGRWLQPDDTNALVVPTSLLALEPELALGGMVTLRIGNREEAWQIVGITQLFQPPIAPLLIYANQPYVWQRMGGWGRINLLRVLTVEHDRATHVAVAQAAQTRLQQVGFKVQSVRNASEDRTIFSERFNIITVILMLMAFLLATVGSLGLMGTMSINVLERWREIGVMRAIGAADGAVIRIFVIEGIGIGVISWAGAVLLSQPMSRAMSYAVGMNFASLPLSYVYNLSAPLLWLLIVVVVAGLASLIPARTAANLSVRETLAYEG